MTLRSRGSLWQPFLRNVVRFPLSVGIPCGNGESQRKTDNVLALIADRRLMVYRPRMRAFLTAAFLFLAAPAMAQPPCPGDCNGDDATTPAEFETALRAVFDLAGAGCAARTPGRRSPLDTLSAYCLACPGGACPPN